MAIKLKPISEQVIVIVGASSGIGLATARQAARRGAKVVAVARNGEALTELEREINSRPHERVGARAGTGASARIGHASGSRRPVRNGP